MSPEKERGEQGVHEFTWWHGRLCPPPDGHPEWGPSPPRSSLLFQEPHGPSQAKCMWLPELTPRDISSQGAPPFMGPGVRGYTPHPGVLTTDTLPSPPPAPSPPSTPPWPMLPQHPRLYLLSRQPLWRIWGSLGSGSLGAFGTSVEAQRALCFLSCCIYSKESGVFLKSPATVGYCNVSVIFESLAWHLPFIVLYS